MSSPSDPLRGLPETTEYIRVRVACAALENAVWSQAVLVELAAELPFCRAVILDCQAVGRFEHGGMDAINQLLRALTTHRCRVLIIPPTRADFRAVWTTSGANLRFPEPTPAQLARAVDAPADNDDDRFAINVA